MLLDEARPLLVQVAQALRATALADTGEGRRLTVGFVPSATNVTLPAHLRAFPARYPEVELFLREMAPDGLVARLHSGSVDACFVYRPFADERLASRTVAREPLIVALPAEHPLAPAAPDRCA